MMTINEAIRLALRGETVSDADVLAFGKSLAYFEITCGDASWDVCATVADADRAWSALREFSRRYDALRPRRPAPTPAMIDAADRAMMAAMRRPRRGRCQNRDCGDPSCRGNCGY